ncbi:MAG TPA: alpha/beta hydrolase [Actinomycetota bacterium]|nr:alpha/beta hydrolase [Actinomycetota bacterium]
MRGRAPGPPGVASLVLFIVCSLALSSCGGGEGTAPDLSGSEAVAFTSRDGVDLEGRVFGQGATAVVLSHMLPADQRSWFGYARRLAEQGYLVLTYDFRGYCPGGDGGCSQGERDVSSTWQDVLGAIDLVRSRGATRVVLVGASMGGTASLVAAAEEGADVEAVVTLSAPRSIEGLVADGPLLQQISAGKLFVAGVGDATAAAAAEELYATSPPPKRVEVVPADDHGTDLLTGAQGEVVKRLIETTLAQYAPA